MLCCWYVLHAASLLLQLVVVVGSMHAGPSGMDAHSQWLLRAALSLTSTKPSIAQGLPGMSPLQEWDVQQPPLLLAAQVDDAAMHNTWHGSCCCYCYCCF
jgi:hypothetical protein